MNQNDIATLAEIIGDPEKTKAVIEIIEKAQERESKQRKKLQADGISAAKARGVQFGRPRLKIPKNFPLIYEQCKNKTLTVTAAAKMLHMSRTSLHRMLAQYEEMLKDQESDSET